MKIILPFFLCLFSFSLLAQEYEVSANNQVAPDMYVLTYKPVEPDSNSVADTDPQTSGMQAVNEFNQYGNVQNARYDAATSLITVTTNNPADLPKKIRIDAAQLNQTEEPTPEN